MKQPLPKLAHSVRPVGDDGFTRVTPHQLYVDIREGVSVLMVDIRPKAEFDIYHILGCYNCPAATFTASDIEDVRLILAFTTLLLLRHDTDNTFGNRYSSHGTDQFTSSLAVSPQT